MTLTRHAALCALTAGSLLLAPLASPLTAQDEDGGGAGEIIVTAMRRDSSLSQVQALQLAQLQKPPVIGLRRQADSAVRNIEIFSDSREAAMRRREVQAMLLAAIDKAKTSGFSLVTGELEIVEVTRANWQDQFPQLAGKPGTRDEDDEDEDYDEDGDGAPSPAYEDDGQELTLRLKIKTPLQGSIGNAQQRINGFVKSVPATGRSLIRQKGTLALTIIRPEQYRPEIYRRIAAGAKDAAAAYGPDYAVTVSRLDEAVAWQQVSNTEIFLYIPYDFTVVK